jgi:MSHA pilin protein MshC
MNVRNNRGFTLVELISVLLIMGIVAAVVVNRVGTSNNEVIAQIEVVKSHLRYAQSRAMNSDKNSDKQWGVRFDTSRYWLFKDGNISNKVTFPAEDSDTVTLPSGMSVGTETVTFDDWGKPYTDAAGTLPQSDDRPIVFLPSLTNHAIIITQNTGFIE